VAGTFCQGFNNTGARAARLATNGSALVGSQVSVQAATTSVATSITVSRMVYLNVADYLELQGFQSSGGALNTSVATEAQSQMSLFWLGV
jgi:DNA uptake protein ComE-like DNA-binding protein